MTHQSSTATRRTTQQAEQVSSVPSPAPLVRERVQIEYVTVPDEANERHWLEAVKSMVRVHGRRAQPLMEELKRIKELKRSGDPYGTLS